MGGRYYYDRKATVEESCGLTIKRLRELGLLTGCQSTTINWTNSMFGKRITLLVTADVTTEPNVKVTYSLSDRSGNFESKVDLETTPCNLGGRRYWFVCPLCGRYVGGLYLPPGSVHFGCRHCYNLTYRSRNRGFVEASGHLSRQIKNLQGEIKRWTWRGEPTKKVKRLHALERKQCILSNEVFAMLDHLTYRFRS